MTAQIFALSANGATFGSTTIAMSLIDDGTIHTFEKPCIYDLGERHSVTVIHAGNTQINSLPADLVIRDWIRNLQDPFPKLEDYVGAFIEHIETTDLRNFQDDGEGSWKGRSLLWKLQSKGDEIVNEIVNSDSELFELANDFSSRSNVKHLQQTHDRLLMLIDQEILKRFETADYYTSFPLAAAVDFLQEDLAESEYSQSCISWLGAPFENLLEDFNDPDIDSRLCLPLSDDFIRSLMHLASLILCTKSKEDAQGAVLTFVGYGQEQSIPCSTTIVVDGVLIQAQYFSEKIDDVSSWAGIQSFSSKPWAHPPMEPGSSDYPLWVCRPNSNKPLVVFSVGGTGVLYTWLNGNREGKIQYDRERNFNSSSRYVHLKNEIAIVESILKLESLSGLFEEGVENSSTLGSPIEIGTMQLGKPLKWITPRS